MVFANYPSGGGLPLVDEISPSEDSQTWLIEHDFTGYEHIIIDIFFNQSHSSGTPNTGMSWAFRDASNTLINSSAKGQTVAGTSVLYSISNTMTIPNSYADNGGAISTFSRFNIDVEVNPVDTNILQGNFYFFTGSYQNGGSNLSTGIMGILNILELADFFQVFGNTGNALWEFTTSSVCRIYAQ